MGVLVITMKRLGFADSVQPTSLEGMSEVAGSGSEVFQCQSYTSLSGSH